MPLLGNVLAANLLERSIFNATLLYLPSFLMLSYGLATADVAPALALVAIGTLIGNASAAGGRPLPRPTGDDLRLRPMVAGGVGLVLFGVAPELVISVVLGAVFGMVNASSRRRFWHWARNVTRYRGALLGVLSLTNQGGTVVGSSLGGLAIASGGYGTLALLTMCGGLGPRGVGAAPDTPQSRARSLRASLIQGGRQPGRDNHRGRGVKRVAGDGGRHAREPGRGVQPPVRARSSVPRWPACGPPSPRTRREADES